MRRLALLTRTCLLSLAILSLGASGCSSSDDLPAIKSSQAKSFAKKMAKVSCTRLHECMAEKMGDEEVDDSGVEECRTFMETNLVAPLKECERWDKDLAKVCLEDIENFDCKTGDTIRADSCDELLENCGLQESTESLRAELNI